MHATARRTCRNSSRSPPLKYKFVDRGRQASRCLIRAKKQTANRQLLPPAALRSKRFRPFAMGPGALARSGLARLNEYQAHYPPFKGVFSKQFMAVSSRKAVLWREGRPGMVSHTRMWATFRQSTRASPRDLAFKIPSDQVCSMDKGYCTARCDQELEDWKRWGPYAWTSQATVPLINEFSQL